MPNISYISPSPHLSVSRITPPNTRSRTSPNNSASAKKGLFQFVKKTGPSLKNRLVNVKNLALRNTFGRTSKCGTKNCKCCKMVSDKTAFAYKDKTVKAAGGSCSSYNIIYLFECRLCGSRYVGRSTRALRTRVGEHRRAFYRLCENKEYDKESDEFVLGHHIFSDHNLCERDDFDKSYSVSLLDICSPKVLDIKEHKFIHLLNTLNPNGLNLDNPFAIPLLYR